MVCCSVPAQHGHMYFITCELYKIFTSYSHFPFSKDQSVYIYKPVLVLVTHLILACSFNVFHVTATQFIKYTITYRTRLTLHIRLYGCMSVCRYTHSPGVLVDVVYLVNSNRCVCFLGLYGPMSNNCDCLLVLYQS